MITARLSSIAVDTRNRLRSSAEAIPAPTRGTETRLLNAPSKSKGRTSATLTSRSRPYVVSHSPLHERTSRKPFTTPAVRSAAIETTASAEKRGTALAVSPQRSSLALARVRIGGTPAHPPTLTRPPHAPSRLQPRAHPQRVRAPRQLAWRRSRPPAHTQPLPTSVRFASASTEQLRPRSREAPRARPQQPRVAEPGAEHVAHDRGSTLRHPARAHLPEPPGARYPRTRATLGRARKRRGRSRGASATAIGSPTSTKASAAAPPTTSKISVKLRKRTSQAARSTVRDPACSSSTWRTTPASPAPGRPTWNTNVPLRGCESADKTRHATVYVP